MKGPSHASPQGAPLDAGTGQPAEVHPDEEPVERFPEGLLDGLVVPPFSTDVLPLDPPRSAVPDKRDGAPHLRAGASEPLKTSSGESAPGVPWDSGSTPPPTAMSKVPGTERGTGALQQRLRVWAQRLGTSLTGSGDTPKRVAGGVALGVFIAFTPTLGLQMLIYAAAAAVLPVNKLAGFPALFISNPLTAVPIYYAGWWVGARVLRSGPEGAAVLLGENEHSGQGAMWSRLWDALLSVGAEVWVGSVLLGCIAAVVAYLLTFRYVLRHT